MAEGVEFAQQPCFVLIFRLPVDISKFVLVEEVPRPPICSFISKEWRHDSRRRHLAGTGTAGTAAAATADCQDFFPN
jgi:hypothetical protein